MKIFQLNVNTIVNGGVYSNPLITIKNGQQLEEVAESLNKKYIKDEVGNKINFTILEIDTTKIKDSLSKLDMKNIY